MKPVIRKQQVNENNISKNDNEIIDKQNKIIELSKQNNGVETRKRIYKLQIRVDKIKTRPKPKNNKTLIDTSMMNQGIDKINEFIKNNLPTEIKINIKKELPDNSDDSLSTSMSQRIAKINENIDNIKKELIENEKDPLADNSIKITQSNQLNNSQKKKCMVCQDYFSGKIKLAQQTNENHFHCRVCGFPCGNKTTHDFHEKLHISNDKDYPYKCHICKVTFNRKEVLKTHINRMHSCGSIKLIKKNTSNLTDTEKINKTQLTIPNINRNQLVLNTKNKNVTLLVPAKGWKSTNKIYLQKSPTGSLQPDKRNLIINLNDGSFKKCKLCQQYVKTTDMEKHLVNHISRAHPCVLCKKLFINNDALQTHVKTHNN